MAGSLLEPVLQLMLLVQEFRAACDGTQLQRSGNQTELALAVQAGRPKTITGFQTHETPVLLSVGERAELATNKYIALSSVLEGVVILKPNPDYVDTGP